MSDVKDSHYISRVLLQYWERKPGKLNYFDFSAGRIGDSSARGMYISPTAFPAHVEKWQSDTFETPIGQYLTRTKVAHKRGDAEPPVPTERESRAIVIALLAQPIRTSVAHGEPDSLLVKLASEDESYLTGLIEARMGRIFSSSGLEDTSACTFRAKVSLHCP